MPDKYYAVCIDCGDILDTGKLIDTDSEGNAIPWAFNGWFDVVDGEWRKVNLFQLLSYFLIFHRGHEIRLLSETCMKQVDPEGWLAYYDSSNELLQRKVDPEPDGEIDCLAVPETVKEKLRQHASANEIQLEGDWDRPRRE